MRHDIIITILGSVILVGGVFYIGFHRWLPLIGMGCTLLLCCLVALATGLLIFGELNMVTIGFCAILIGLGVDFAILIFGRYQQARDEGCDYSSAVSEAVKNLGQAVFFGALTTAVGFLALVLSNSAGFTQLGVLIAIGIFLAGIFMMSIFFLFLPQKHRPWQNDWVFALVKNYVRWAVRRPALMLWIATPVLLLLTAIAASPRPRLIFDASTQSMEPKSSAASYALHTIMEKMPDALGTSDRDHPLEQSAGIARSMAESRRALGRPPGSGKDQKLLHSGRARPFTAAVGCEPREITARSILPPRIRRLKRQSLRKALARKPSRPLSRFSMICARVAQPNATLPDWRTLLPPTSSWWFLVDRYFAHDPLLTTGFVTTHEPITTQAQKQMLTRELPVAGVPMTLSGWSFTLTDLIPWSHRQLILISAMMAVFEGALLALLYRDWRLWVIHVATLIFAVGAMIASMKLLHLPLNLLNVLAFRLVLAVGVDYGIYVLLVWQKARELEHDVAGVIKPVILAGLTAVAGFRRARLG